MRLILLHGWTMEGSVFDDLRAVLPQVETLAPDLPGHGHNTHPSPSLDACAEALAELLSQGPACVLGWSMGAATCWRYVSRFGMGNLQRLITVDMSPRVMNAPDWTLGVKGQRGADANALYTAMARDWDQSANGIAQTMFAPDRCPKGWDTAQTAQRIATQDPKRLLPLWRDLLELDERAIVPQITCPWLICYGGRSRVYPTDTALWLQQHAQRGQLAGFDLSGHSPHIEDPVVFAKTLKNFLDLS
jgi:pimeloyl-[acyl-carrier protein] methyl ester esterase